VVIVSQTFPPKVSGTVERISGTDRKLLALRSYVRNRSSLEEKWSWSAQRIASFAGSAEYRAVETELANIRRQFEKSNAGYTLYVNSQVRSLDAQLEKWNDNESVGAAAKALEKVAGKNLPREGCQNAEGRKAFSDFLAKWYPARTPTLAAPGLSKHGQGRAFDFQVKRGNEIVAGTDSKSSIASWDKKGWTEKLRAAVQAASSKFSGPLKMPYEPWHYEYRP
jgi:ribosomal protein L17